MSSPQEGTARKHEKRRRTRKLAEWRAKQAAKPAPAAAKAAPPAKAAAPAKAATPAKAAAKPAPAKA